MSIVPVPSLSAKGWILDIEGRADQLMSHFFTSMNSQSYLYAGKIANLQFLIEQKGHDPISLTNAIKDMLTRYLGSYFTSVDVGITTDANNPGVNANKYSISMSVYVTENDTEYSLFREIQMLDSKLANILTINNYG